MLGFINNYRLELVDNVSEYVCANILYVCLNNLCILSLHFLYSMCILCSICIHPIQSLISLDDHHPFINHPDSFQITLDFLSTDILIIF